MFKQLLVPLDGSSLAEQALGQAVAIARTSKARMDLVRVHEPFPFRGVGDAPWNAELLNDERRYLEAIVAELSSGASVPATHAILRGEPVDMICRRVWDIDADLLVMTSHGRTGLSRAWLGSVADGVLRHSTVPVLMLRPIEGKTRRDAAHHLFKRILVPIDGSALSTEVLPAATALAKCAGARISLLRVVQPIPLVSPEAGIGAAYMSAPVDEPSTKQLVEVARKQLHEAVWRMREAGAGDLEMEVVVEPRVGPAIVDFARSHDIDAVAMSTHGRGMSRLLLGSVVDKVLRGSGLPMLLYRPLSLRGKVPVGETSAEANAPAI